MQVQGECDRGDIIGMERSVASSAYVESSEQGAESASLMLSWRLAIAGVRGTHILDDRLCPGCTYADATHTQIMPEDLVINLMNQASSDKKLAMEYILGSGSCHYNGHYNGVYPWVRLMSLQWLLQWSISLGQAHVGSRAQG